MKYGCHPFWMTTANLSQQPSTHHDVMHSTNDQDAQAPCESTAQITPSQSEADGNETPRRKHRKIAFDIDPFVDRPQPKTVKLKCCGVVRVENQTQVRRQFKSCWSFRRTFLQGLMELNYNKGSSVSKWKSKQSGTYTHSQFLSLKHRHKLDEAFGDAIITDDLPFNIWKCKNWQWF